RRSWWLSWVSRWMLGHGQVEVFGQVAVGAAQFGDLSLQVRHPAGSVLSGRCNGAPVVGDLACDVGVVAPEGGVGQSEAAGQGQNTGAPADRVGFGEDVVLGLVYCVVSGQWGLAGHGVPGCWAARNRASWSAAVEQLVVQQRWQRWTAVENVLRV